MAPLVRRLGCAGNAARKCLCSRNPVGDAAVKGFDRLTHDPGVMGSKGLTYLIDRNRGLSILKRI